MAGLLVVIPSGICLTLYSFYLCCEVLTLNSELTAEERSQPYESYPLLAVYWAMLIPFVYIWA